MTVDNVTQTIYFADKTLWERVTFNDNGKVCCFYRDIATKRQCHFFAKEDPIHDTIYTMKNYGE